MSKSLRQRLKDTRESRALAEADLANMRDALIQVSKLVPRKWLTITSKKDREEALERVGALLTRRSGAAFLSEVYTMQRRLSTLAAFADDVGALLDSDSEGAIVAEMINVRFEELKAAL